MPTTLAEIAKITGFSIPTVSRVLSNSNYPVNSDTRQQIIDVAEHLKGKQLKEDVRENRGCHRYYIYHHNINIAMDCTDQIEVLDISLGGISFKSDLQFQTSIQYELRLKFKDQVIPMAFKQLKRSMFSSLLKFYTFFMY